MNERKIGSSVYGKVIQPDLEYLGGVAQITNAGSQAIAIPTGATIFEISAEGGDIFFAINLGFANANSSGYCPENVTRTIGPLSNLVALHVYGAASDVAHILFYREV